MSKKSAKKPTPAKAAAPKAAPATQAPAASPKESEPSADAGTVRVRLKKHCQFGGPGDLVTVSHALAQQMCRVRHVDMGGGVLEHFSVAEAEDEIRAEATMENLTSAEAQALGRRNVVATPVSPLDLPPSNEEQEPTVESEIPADDEQEPSFGEGESEDPALIDGAPQD